MHDALLLTLRKSKIIKSLSLGIVTFEAVTLDIVEAHLFIESKIPHEEEGSSKESGSDQEDSKFHQDSSGSILT